jgi:hypothetical protein
VRSGLSSIDDAAESSFNPNLERRDDIVEICIEYHLAIDTHGLDYDGEDVPCFKFVLLS